MALISHVNPVMTSRWQLPKTCDLSVPAIPTVFQLMTQDTSRSAHISCF